MVRSIQTTVNEGDQVKEFDYLGRLFEKDKVVWDEDLIKGPVSLGTLIRVYGDWTIAI